MKKLLIMVICAFILLGLGYSQRASIAKQLLSVALPQQMGANQIAALEDGLHVALCGAGGPMPAPRASGPCVAIVAGAQLFIVDAGTDGARNLAAPRVPNGCCKRRISDPLPLGSHRRPRGTGHGPVGHWRPRYATARVWP